MNAATAALKEIAVIVASQHVTAGLACAADQAENRQAAMDALLDILQVVMRKA